MASNAADAAPLKMNDSPNAIEYRLVNCVPILTPKTERETACINRGVSFDGLSRRDRFR